MSARDEIDEAAGEHWAVSGGGTDPYATWRRAFRAGAKWAEESEREANCAAIRAACEACAGSGNGEPLDVREVGTDEDGAALVDIVGHAECEYCGRPIAAIRARATTEESSNAGE